MGFRRRVTGVYNNFKIRSTQLSRIYDLTMIDGLELVKGNVSKIITVRDLFVSLPKN
jgi:hypothetical protein